MYINLNDKKTLILLTSEFPYGTGETFLENEFPFLTAQFDEILIFTENRKGLSRINSEKVQVNLLSSANWFNRIQSFFSTEFYKEIYHLSKNKKLNLFTFRTVWYSMSKAFVIANFIEKWTLEKGCFFYSYWLDEKSISLALLKKKHPNINVVSRAHGWDVYEERHTNNYLPFRNLLFETLDSVYTISENAKKYFNSAYLSSNSNTEISRLGTLPLNSVSEKIKDSHFHFLSISSLISLKRVDKILELVSSIPELKIKWTHIGSGQLHDKLSSIASKKSQENINFSFEFLGQKSNSEVRNFLSSNYVDLFINLSETEGIPVSIMEAQSAGIPALATNVGGTSEIVNSDNGFLIPKDFEVADLASKIKYYLKSSEEEIEKKRQSAYQNWKQFYNAETNYKYFVNQFTKY